MFIESFQFISSAPLIICLFHVIVVLLSFVFKGFQYMTSDGTNGHLNIYIYIYIVLWVRVVVHACRSYQQIYIAQPTMHLYGKHRRRGLIARQCVGPDGGGAAWHFLAVSVQPTTW